MGKKRKQWKRMVSLAMAFLLMFTILPADMPEARAAEETLENITKDCVITPPSTEAANPLENMYDGNTGTQWVNNGADWPCTVEFALPASNTKCVKKVVLKFENQSSRSMDVSLKYALNGVTSDLISVEGSQQTATLADGYTYVFETPQAMSHLYVTLDNPLTNGAAGQFWPAIAEAEIYIDNGAEEEIVLENIAATRKSRVKLEDSVNTEENQGLVTDNDAATFAPLQTKTFDEITAQSGTLPFAEVSFGCNQKMRQFVLEMKQDASGAQYAYTIYGKTKRDTGYTEITSGTVGTSAADCRAEQVVSDLGLDAKEVEYESVKVEFGAANDAAKGTIPQLAEFQVLANQASIAEADNENIVWGTTAIRSNCNQDTVGRVVDGNTANTWTADRYPCYVDIDLEGEYDLSRIEVYMPQTGYSQYSIYYSKDGQNYTKLAEKDTHESCPASGEIWDASGARASSVRVLLEYHSASTKAVLNEVRVMGSYVGAEKKASFTPPADYAGSAYDVAVTPQDTIDEVKGIVSRNLGAAYVDWFEFSLGEAGDYDYFELEDAADGKVRITGNDGVSMAVGLNHYLKYFCQVSITQVGNQVKMPETAPKVGAKVHKECKVPVRYAYNYCTMSYSMPFWGENEWRKELDWLALNGVNTVLDITGQEEVWRRFLKTVGYSHEEIKDYLAGPAFYAWAYMANLSGWGGPVHDSWFVDRVELARKNQLSMRKLGMQPILQGYSGMVPVDIAQKATVTGYTVSGSDVIAQGNWCGFQRPYMLRTTSDAYKAYASLFYQCQEQVYGNVTHYYATDPFHEGGNTGGMSASDVSSNVMEQLLTKDPQAVWVIQAWQGNPSAALMTGLGENREHAIVLDLYAEKDPHWSNSGYAGGKEFMGTPWVYCMLNNFGGRMGLHGHMDNLVNGVVDAANTASHFTGIGITPEASQNNPVLYELLFETVWCDDASQTLTKIDTASWLRDYTTRRYGAESENAYQAMRILEETVYKASLNMRGQGAPESYLNARPATSIGAASTWGNSVIGYDMEKLEKAAELLMEDYDLLKGSDGYLYDLADVLKQVLSNTAQKYHREMIAAMNAGDLAAFTEKSDRFLGLADKVEEVLSTRKEFLLGTWTGQAEDLAQNADDFTKDLYLFNAKAIVTTWGTHANTESGGLKDYSNRQWAGLTKDYYRKRWEMWIEYQKERLAGNSPQAINWFEFEFEWARDKKKYSAECSGADLWELGQEILTDYSSVEHDPASDASCDYPAEKIQASAGSQETANENTPIQNALDGDAGTIWHTKWSSGNDNASYSNHYVVLELAEETQIAGLRYQPRQDSSQNGVITQYEVYVSKDGLEYEKKAEGSWAGDRTWKLASFEAPVQAKYVKLVSLNALADGNGCFSSAAEIRVTLPPVKVERISVTAEKNEIRIGETLQLTAEVFPENATNRKVNWSSKDENIAVVNRNGLVTAKAKGTVEIWANTTDGSNLGECFTLTVVSDALQQAQTDYESMQEVLQSLYADRDKYSDTTWAALEAASAAAEKLYESSKEEGSSVSAEELQALLAEVQKSITNLKTKEQEKADAEEAAALKKAKETAAAELAAAEVIVKAGQKDYTDASWKTFLSAYQALKNAPANTDSKSLDTLTASLAQARKALAKKTDGMGTLAAPVITKLKADAGKKCVSVKITVGKVDGASRYEVYCVSGGKERKVGTTKPGKTSLRDKKLTKKSAQYYAVALSADGKVKSQKGTLKKITLGKGTKIKSARNTGKGIRITWKKIRNAKSYAIYRSSKKKSGYKRIAKVTKKGCIWYLDKKAKRGKTYYYKVAVCGKKQTSMMSKASKKVKRS